MRRNILIASVVVCFVVTYGLGQEYKTVREARLDAARHLQVRNFAAAQAPLEAALKLTPEADLKQRVELYRTLMEPYRVLNNVEKMMEAVEYIQANSDSQPERSIIATDYVSFLHQRGKTDFAVERYEAKLKENPKDPTALAVLSTVYQRVIREKKERGQMLEAELKKLNRERAVAKAERLEKSADADERAAASNWKDVAKTWLEADDKEKAKTAVEKSLKARPEGRSELLTMYWHDGLGDVYAEVGDTAKALEQYEKAIAKTPSEPLKRPLRDKIEKLKKSSK